MKNVREELIPILESALEESLNAFEITASGNSLSDLYLYLDGDTSVLSVYDDIENKLHEINLEQEQEDDPEHFEDQLISTLKQVLSRLEQQHLFDQDFIFKPFAVSMVDDDFIVSEELIFIDDNTLKLDGDLMTNLDRELDEFLKELMN
ncbi:MAG: hypothetical protein LBJ72_04100 [Dysgonamonadaceae bacterium]|jgi:hypothetical protein|nr:hypothetical protein [Dysgonamonadaceae bacterium]